MSKDQLILNPVEDVSKMVIVPETHIEEDQTVHDIEEFLDQIDKNTLITIFIYLKQNKEWFLAHREEVRYRTWEMYDDLLMLSFFKMNQHQLCSTTQSIISKLALLIKKTTYQVQSRLWKLQNNHYQKMKAILSLRQDYMYFNKDLFLQFHSDIQSNSSQQAENKPENKPESAFIFQKFPINESKGKDGNKQNKKRTNSIKFTQKEKQSIHIIFQQLEKRNQSLKNLEKQNQIKRKDISCNYYHSQLSLNQQLFGNPQIRVIKISGRIGQFIVNIDMLNQINQDLLIKMIQYQKQNKPWFLQKIVHLKPKRMYTLYEDLIILSLFKINQHYLSQQNCTIMKKQLSLCLKRSSSSIQKRTLFLMKLQIQVIIAAIKNDYDINMFHKTKEKANQWQKRKSTRRTRPLNGQIQGKVRKCYLCLELKQNPKRKLWKQKLQINFIKSSLSDEELKFIHQVFIKTNNQTEIVKTILACQQQHNEQDVILVQEDSPELSQLSNEQLSIQDSFEQDKSSEEVKNSHDEETLTIHNVGIKFQNIQTQTLSQSIFHEKPNQIEKTQNIIATTRKENQSTQQRTPQLNFNLIVQSEIQGFLNIFEQWILSDKNNLSSQHCTFFNKYTKVITKIDLRNVFLQCKHKLLNLSFDPACISNIGHYLEMMTKIYFKQRKEYQQRLKQKQQEEALLKKLSRIPNDLAEISKSMTNVMTQFQQKFKVVPEKWKELEQIYDSIGNFINQRFDP